MDSVIFRFGMVSLSVGMLTPMLMGLWSKLSPPGEASPFDVFDPSVLHSRNNWIDRVGCVLCLAGIFAPILLYGLGVVSSRSPWPLGIGCGLMVILPTIFVALVTLPRGMARYREFWRFYELRYKIGLPSLFALYVLMGSVGVFSAFKLWL